MAAAMAAAKVGGDGATATATASGTSTMGGNVYVRADNSGGNGGERTRLAATAPMPRSSMRLPGPPPALCL